MQEADIALSRLMDPADITEVFAANDSYFLVPVSSIAYSGIIRSFPAGRVYPDLKALLASIHVFPTQQGTSPSSFLCKDHYTEELWSLST